VLTVRVWACQERRTRSQLVTKTATTPGRLLLPCVASLRRRSGLCLVPPTTSPSRCPSSHHNPPFPPLLPIARGCCHVFDGACGLPSVGGRCIVTTAPDFVARTSLAAVRMVEELCRGISCSFVFSPRGSRAIPPLFGCPPLFHFQAKSLTDHACVPISSVLLSVNHHRSGYSSVPSLLLSIPCVMLTVYVFFSPHPRQPDQEQICRTEKPEALSTRKERADRRNVGQRRGRRP